MKWGGDPFPPSILLSFFLTYSLFFVVVVEGDDLSFSVSEDEQLQRAKEAAAEDMPSSSTTPPPSVSSIPSQPSSRRWFGRNAHQEKTSAPRPLNNVNKSTACMLL